MRSLSWYIKRASVMHPTEVLHRIRERVVLARLRREHRFGETRPAELKQPNDFQFCTETSDQLPTLSWNFDPTDDGIRQLLQGQWPALGFPWKWEPGSHLWSRAPDTGKAWPSVFFGSIPYHNGNLFGDIRIAWEPSRLQQLVSLALLARQDTAHAEQAIGLLENILASWVEANPPLTGIHYVSAMESALRLIAVCHAVDLVRMKLRTQERTRTNLLQLVASHAPLIARRLSLYSSAGNHTIAEGCGLVYAGTLFPEFSGASEWKAVGLRILEQESARQVLPDGGGIEQALGYHLFIIDLLGLVQALLEYHGESVPATVTNAVQKGRTFLGAFEINRNDLPLIGDYDSGYALSRHLRISMDGTADRSEASITFPDSSYTLLRGYSPYPFRLFFDHGALGMPPCFAHGHADALSVNFYFGGQEILVDPGTYTYTGDPAWRAYFRGTRAHNVVIVDRVDQAVQETAFMWSQPFRSKLSHQHVTPEGVVTVIANHDGYKSRFGVTHWRGVIYEPTGRWLIWDYLSGSGSHHLELNWHLAIEPKATPNGYILKCDDGLLRLLIDGGTTTLHTGETNPISGWQSTQYGMKKPISTLHTTFNGPLPHEFITQVQIDGVGPPDHLLTTLLFFREFVHETQSH